MILRPLYATIDISGGWHIVYMPSKRMTSTSRSGCGKIPSDSVRGIPIIDFRSSPDSAVMASIKYPIHLMPNYWRVGDSEKTIRDKLNQYIDAMMMAGAIVRVGE